MKIKYIRNKDRKPVGVVVIKDNKVGWSACHKNDKWDRKLALRIAVSRCCGTSTIPPTHVRETYEHFKSLVNG